MKLKTKKIQRGSDFDSHYLLECIGQVCLNGSDPFENYYPLEVLEEACHTLIQERMKIKKIVEGVNYYLQYK